MLGAIATAIGSIIGGGASLASGLVGSAGSVLGGIGSATAGLAGAGASAIGTAGAGLVGGAGSVLSTGAGVLGGLAKSTVGAGKSIIDVLASEEAAKAAAGIGGVMNIFRQQEPEQVPFPVSLPQAGQVTPRTLPTLFDPAQTKQQGAQVLTTAPMQPAQIDYIPLLLIAGVILLLFLRKK